MTLLSPRWPAAGAVIMIAPLRRIWLDELRLLGRPEGTPRARAEVPHEGTGTPVPERLATRLEDGCLTGTKLPGRSRRSRRSSTSEGVMCRGDDRRHKRPLLGNGKSDRCACFCAGRSPHVALPSTCVFGSLLRSNGRRTERSGFPLAAAAVGLIRESSGRAVSVHSLPAPGNGISSVTIMTRGSTWDISALPGRSTPRAAPCLGSARKPST
jgi:hypothetical protein